MSERFQWFLVRLLLHGSIWLVAIFPVQIVLSYLYGVDYIYPDLIKLVELSVSYWAAIILPPIFRWICGLLDDLFSRILGELWVFIQNEFSLLQESLTNGKVSQRFWPQVRGFFSLLFAVLTIVWVIHSLVSYETASFVAVAFCGGLSISFIQWLKNRRESEEE